MKCFDAAGKLTATHGRAGRSQARPLPAARFFQPAGIAADGHGGFVVTEKSTVPRRTARFDAKGEQ